MYRVQQPASYPCQDTAAAVPTREMFHQAVRRIKAQENMKLRDILEDKDQNQDAARQARARFFGDPTISAYLQRRSDTLTFARDCPGLSRSAMRSDKALSDAYELNVYRYTPKHVFPWRCDADSSEFYSQGGVGSQFRYCLAELTEKYAPYGIRLLTPRDIYRIRYTVNQWFILGGPPKVEGTPTPRFVIAPIFKDAHATLMLTIVDAGWKPLASVFVNSWSCDKYTRDMDARFNMKDFYSWEQGQWQNLGLPSLEQVMGKCGAHAESEPFRYVDATTNTVYYWRMWDGKDAKKFDIAYNLERQEFESVRVNRTIPIVDASHMLQAEDTGDHNCTLYTLNFLQAVGELLSNNENAARVQRLAASIAIDPDAPQRAELSDMFKYRLRAHLPAYYLPDGTPRAADELKTHHLRQRWDLGSLSLRRLAAEGYQYR